MSNTNGQPVLILGMHRSGTSFLAQLLQTMGVFIGDELVGPEKGNPRGHYESVPVLEYHLRLIAERLPARRRAFDEGMLVQQTLEGAITEAERADAEKLLKALRRPGPWGWKEPRTCLFLDLWKQLLPNAVGVVVYRHPLEVHQSLLRREHWDLALFPDQAMRAYCHYNREILRFGDSIKYIFNANSGFCSLDRLAADLGKSLNLNPPHSMPEFHQGEFSMRPVSRTLHRLFALIFPEAAATFEALQDKAGFPYEWEAREDDQVLEALIATVEKVVDGLPGEGRAFLAPLLDWWSSQRDDAIFDLYEKLGEEIGARVQRVEQWNREAAGIYEENERLSADYERMGRHYAEQQKFLDKQAKMQEKIWGELERTGKSWEEQKQIIEDLLAEKRGLFAEIAQLRKQLEKNQGAGQ